jgi:hypothetical protein
MFRRKKEKPGVIGEGSDSQGKSGSTELPHKPTTDSDDDQDGNKATQDRGARRSKLHRGKMDDAEAIGRLTATPLLAFRVWEGIIATLNEAPEYGARFAFAQDMALILDRHGAKEDDYIYEIERCYLPCILRPTRHRSAHFRLIGEACVGKTPSGEWVAAIDSALPPVEVKSLIENTKGLMPSVELDSRQSWDGPIFGYGLGSVQEHMLPQTPGTLEDARGEPELIFRAGRGSRDATSCDGLSMWLGN